jgi:hypothetical protein
MSRHAKQISRARLHDAVEGAPRIERRMRHELAATDQGHHQADNPDIVAERAQRIHDGVVVEAPILGNGAAIGEERVVGVHDAFGQAGGTGREGKINNAVRRSGVRQTLPGTAPDTAQADRIFARDLVAQWLDPICRLHPCSRTEHGKDVVVRGVGTIAGLGHKRRRSGALEQRDDVATCVIAMQRCVARITHARACEQRERGLDPARQPDRHPVARHQARVVQVLRDGVGPFERGPVGQPAVGVAQSEPVRLTARVLAKKHVEGLGTPVAPFVE